MLRRYSVAPFNRCAASSRQRCETSGNSSSMCSITWKIAGFIASWDRAKRGVLHDYVVNSNKSGRSAVIDLKGCLDGDNTKLFERPSSADEFVIWGLCTNVGADPRRNAWSGIHTRISSEIIARNQIVDGLVIWDMMCGTSGRSCPKVGGAVTISIEARCSARFVRRLPASTSFLPRAPSIEAPSVGEPTVYRGVELLAAFQAWLWLPR